MLRAARPLFLRAGPLAPTVVSLGRRYPLRHDIPPQNPFVRFSQKMEHSPEIRAITDSTQRLRRLSRLWRELPEAEKRKFEPGANRPAGRRARVRTANDLSVVKDVTTLVHAVVPSEHAHSASKALADATPTWSEGRATNANRTS